MGHAHDIHHSIMTMCCKEFQGWCRAFTVTEVILSILEAILLTFFVAFLTFLILHLIACSDNALVEKFDASRNVTTTVEPVETSCEPNKSTEIWSTLASDIECTWTPSEKTTSVTQYFEQLPNGSVVSSMDQEIPAESDRLITKLNCKALVSDQPHSESVNISKTVIMSLMKMRSSHDMTFECIVTVISELWVITAANCIESVKGVEYQEPFVIVDNFEWQDQTHTISHVAVHPNYRVADKAYDIVALKSKDKLVTAGHKLLQLPTMLDYYMSTIGERFTTIGLKITKSTNKRRLGSSVHKMAVHALPAERCAARPGAGLCVRRVRGPAHAVSAAAGAPLLQGALLLGVGSGRERCAVTCDPSFYVNVAAVREWLDSVIEEH